MTVLDAREVARIFRRAPGALAEAYMTFRERHPPHELLMGDRRWEYFTCGTGKECLLLLAGGARFGDTWFQLISELEDEFRVLATTDPGVPTIADLAAGTLAVLDAEGVETVHVVGTSLGGLLAQFFARSHPDRVASLILSNTLVPEAIPARSTAISLKLARLFPTRVLQRSVKFNMLLLLASSGERRAFWKAFWDLKTRTHLSRMTREQALSHYTLALDVAAGGRFSPDEPASWTGRVCLIESADDIGYIRRAQPALRALYPEARIHRFERAGHTPGYNHAKEYARVLRAFVTNRGP